MFQNVVVRHSSDVTHPIEELRGLPCSDARDWPEMLMQEKGGRINCTLEFNTVQYLVLCAVTLHYYTYFIYILYILYIMAIQLVETFKTLNISIYCYSLISVFFFFFGSFCLE